VEHTTLQHPAEALSSLVLGFALLLMLSLLNWVVIQTEIVPAADSIESELM